MRAVKPAFVKVTKGYLEMDVVRKMRERPRLSVPKFGEYVGAAPSRREQILLDQKFPRPFKQVFYRDAENGIRSALLVPGDRAAALGERLARLLSVVPLNDYEAQAQRCNVDAMRKFATVLPSIPTAAATFERIRFGRGRLMIENVEISVNPLVISRRRVAGRDRVGAILPLFSKQHRLGSDGGAAAAELVLRCLRQLGYERVHPADCLVVDIFAGALHRAPARGQRVYSGIESACREIAVRWPALKSRRAA